ncbi:MAG: hypothetical protein ACLGI9_03090, partial [Thermoanaerobaculia bacterium]
AITVAAFHVQPRHLNAIYPLLATLTWPGALLLARRKALALGLVALACIPTLVEASTRNLELTRKDSRLVAYRWILENLPKDERILLDDHGPLLQPDARAVARQQALLKTLPRGPFTRHQGQRLQLLSRYPAEEGRNIVELGHPWWLQREKSDAELRSNPVDLDTSNPLVTRSPKPVEDFRADGIRYVVTNSDARDQYFKSRGKGFPSFVRFYVGLERTKRIKTFDPRDWDGKGPVVWVYDLRQPAPADQAPLTTQGHTPWTPPEL